MAAARKTPRRTVRAKSGAKRTGAERHPVNPTRHPAKPIPTTTLLAEPPGFLIVGIGASAGGLETMEEFFCPMLPSSGMAFVVVSHQPAGYASLLPSLLGKYTAMSVAEATDGTQVELNRVYLAPGRANLAILHGTLHLMDPALHERAPLPIDCVFRSLAEDQKQRVVGIVLSGTGTDGTVGRLRAIKAASGLTIAQDPQSAKYQGMPRSAIAAGVVDVVTPVDRMSEPLRAYARSFGKPTQPLSEGDALGTLRKLFILLREWTGNDFTLYKENTIHRRIERRMHVHQIETLKQYFPFVPANPHELDALFQELLIGVPSFFREPQAFEVLAQKLLPSLVEGKPVVAAARGVATGIVETVPEPLLVLDDQLRVVSANQSFYRTFQVTLREVEQQLLYHLSHGAWNIPELRHMPRQVLPKHTSFQDFIVDRTFPQIGRTVFALNGRRLEQDAAQPG